MLFPLVLFRFRLIRVLSRKVTLGHIWIVVEVYLYRIAERNDLTSATVAEVASEISAGGKTMDEAGRRLQGTTTARNVSQNRVRADG